MNVSVYRSFGDTDPKTCHFSTVIEAIRSGRLKTHTERIRHAVEAGNDAAVDAFKKALPAFTASATFNGPRRREYLMGYNGMVQADIDKLDVEAIELVIRHAKEDPHVVAGYRSPTGRGYKLFIQTACEVPATHPVAFRTVAAYVKATYQVDIDPSCKDINRLCFVAWDPDAFYKEATPLPLIDGLLDISDIGRAQRFLDRFHPILRYVPPWNRWLVFMDGEWKGEGDGAEYRLIEKVWHPELIAEAEERLERMFRDIENEHWLPGDIDGISNQGDPHRGGADDKDREKGKKRVKGIVDAMVAKYTNLDPLKKMLEAASKSADVIIPPAMVDEDPYLVGCKNGFVDLETGEFAPYNCDVIITKKLNVAYNPNARCPRWRQFMREVIPDLRVRAFVAKAAGYCLTGKVLKSIMFLYGREGDNGKSVFMDVLIHIFGDYAWRTSPDLLYKSGYMDELKPHDKAMLFGRRLVVGSEVGKGARMNEAAIKEVTGERTTSACRKYESPFEFTQTAKIWFFGNHSPTVKGTDDAIWGRIKKVHFPAKFDPTQNTDILDQLLKEKAGILNWLIRACKHHIDHGNKAPSAVTEAVNQYRTDEDTLAGFIDERLVKAEGYHVKIGELYEEYVAWCKEEGIDHPATKRILCKDLRERGFVMGYDRKANSKTFEGWYINPEKYAGNAEFS